MDIEHIVARSEAHDSGLCAADTFTRLAFASDPLNLVFAPPALNRDGKAGKDVAEWLPELNRCWYVNRVVQVKRCFGLAMDAREAQATLAVLEVVAAGVSSAPAGSHHRGRGDADTDAHGGNGAGGRPAGALR